MSNLQRCAYWAYTILLPIWGVGCANSSRPAVELPTALLWPDLKRAALFDMEVMDTLQDIETINTASTSVELLAWKETRATVMQCFSYLEALVLARSTLPEQRWCMFRYQRFENRPWNNHVALNMVPVDWAVACGRKSVEYSEIISFLRRAPLVGLKSPFPAHCAEHVAAPTFGVVYHAWQRSTGREPDEAEVRSLLLPLEADVQ
jgi:hypothetical protein